MLRNNIHTKLVLFLLVGSFFVLPSLVNAQGGIPVPPGGGGGVIINPLGNNNLTVGDLIENIIRYLLGLVALVALLAIIVGGGKMVLGFTNEDQIKQGKNIIKWAIIGLAIVLIAYAILTTVTYLLAGG